MRVYEIERKTTETEITMSLDIDGNGEKDVETGIGFLDHMLELFAVHGNFDLKLKCMGDVQVDDHHSVEDIGITLGKAIATCLGDKVGIKRYASVTLPMDEALATVSIDVSGRPYLVFNADLDGKCGEFDLELVEEFFRAVSSYGGLTLHINLEYGENNHHKVEAIFKAFARSLAKACKIVSDKLPSSKGVLE